MTFQYNQESALKAGGTVPLTGPYEGVIASATWGESDAKKTKFLEISFNADNGAKINFLKFYYQKADGTPVVGGSSMINAIMGLTKVQNLSQRQVQGTNYTEAPELIGKKIGLVVQKKLYSKGDGSDGYSFEVKLPFLCGTKQTLKEALENRAAETVDRIVGGLEDLDERKPQQAQSGGFGAQQAGGFGEVPSGFNDSFGPQ